MSTTSQLALRSLYNTAPRIQQWLSIRLFLSWMTIAHSPSKTLPVQVTGSTTTTSGPPVPFSSTVLAIFLVVAASMVISGFLIYRRAIALCRSSTSDSASYVFLEHETSVPETAFVHWLTNVTGGLDLTRMCKAVVIAAWLAYGLVSLLSQFEASCNYPAFLPGDFL
jgi:hypothetical protein